MAPSTDAALLAAYAQYQSLNADLYRAALDDNDACSALTDQMVGPDAVLLNVVPTTVAGVNAVLRRLLPAIEGERWLDRAIAFGDDETLEERRGELPFPYDQIVSCVLTLTALARQSKEA